MKILAIDEFLPGVTLEQVGPYLKEEAAHAWDLYMKGTFREVYFRGDHPGAVLILECEDLREAEAVLASLPLVKANLIKFDLIPLKAFRPFELLFAEEE
ncbi:superoxide dismutase [Gemmatimonadota bacterium]